MSPKRARLVDRKLQDAWTVQRARVDSWEVRPVPDLEWTEVRGFVRNAAATLDAVIGRPARVEQELIELLQSSLAPSAASRPEGPPETPEQAWAELRQHSLKGPFIDAVSRLHAYASIGTLLDDDLPASPEQFVARVAGDLKLLATLLDRLPRAAVEGSATWNLQMLHDVAQARLSFDEGLLTAPVSGLAWLGGVNVKTVQNMLSKGALQAGGPGAADARSARAWLGARDTWQRSCWREAIEVISSGLAAPFRELETKEVSVDIVESEQGKTEWVYVPKAADGSLFTPELVRQRGWTIGPRGDERSFGDYWRALQVLQQVERPCWRRPNRFGSYNTVVGKDWVRISRSELELQLKSAMNSGGRT
jgi:hypothetical protein